jgi:hypothetical protein
MEQEGGKAGRFGDGSEIVIGGCIEVHRQLGPGLLESAYELCLAHELQLRGLRVVIKNDLRRLALSPVFPSSRLPVNPRSSA